MYLIYIDESGTSHINDYRYYVLTAFLVHEKGWRSFLNKINQLKLDYFKGDNPLEIEFHTSHIAKGDKKFQKYTLEERQSILIRLANIIKKNRCRLVTTIIDKEQIRTNRDKTKFANLWAWRLLLERIELFLNKKNKDEMVNYGLICMDSISEIKNNEIQEKFKSFVQDGTVYQKSQYLIENVFFVNSELRPMIQIADFVAWVSRYWYRIQNNKLSDYDSFNLELFEKIKTRYDVNSNGQILGSGIKVFPQ